MSSLLGKCTDFWYGGFKVLFSGTVDFVPVYPRQVALQILSLGAKGIVLVHNHPGVTPPLRRRMTP
nr:JAB domain-containing protein [Entomobacter blattae]